MKFLYENKYVTLIAVSNVNGCEVFLLQHIPASIFGSIISIADMASNKPNILWWTNSPNESSKEKHLYSLKHYLAVF